MSRRCGRRLAASGIAACALGGAAAPAGGDSFTPITMRVSAAPVARLHGPFPIAVAVTADAGVLDVRTASLRVRIKLASECAGDFTHTVGSIVLDGRLTPQPDPSEPYQGSVMGRGKPAAFGVQTICVFLEEEGDNRVFASDGNGQVDVSKACTAAAVRYDRSAAELALAGVQLRHAHGKVNRNRLRKEVSKRRAAADGARRAAASSCGPGVPL